MNNNFNVINHIPCIDQLDKMHTKLAIKENDMLDHINTAEDLKKENIKLKLLLKDYQEIMDKLSKYNIYNKNDLYSFFDNFNNSKENQNENDNSSYETDEDIDFVCANDNCRDDVTIEGEYCCSCKKDLQNCKECNTEFWTDIINRRVCYDCCFDDDELEDEEECIDINIGINIEKKVLKDNNIGISNINKDDIPKFIPDLKKHEKSYINKFKKTVKNIILINKIKKKFLEFKKDEKLVTPQKIKRTNINSLKTLERIKRNYYNYHDELLPKINNIDINADFEIINQYIKDKHLIAIYIILRFYIIFDKYLNKFGH